MWCGAISDCVIRKGDPYLEMRSPKWPSHRRLIRCSQHADEAAPAVIDGHEVPAPGFTTLRQLAVAVTRRDPKMRQANDGD